MNSQFLRRTLAALFFVAPVLAPLSISFAAPAKATGKTKAKTILKKSSVPVVKGLTVQGEGVVTFRATFARGNSNISGAPFSSIGRAEAWRPGARRAIISKSIAQLSGGYSVVVNFVRGRVEGDLGPPRFDRQIREEPIESPEDRAERLRQPSSEFNITFASPGGFRTGQTIPILKPAFTGKPRPANALLSFQDAVRIEGRDVFDGNGKRTRTGKNVIRTWVGVSGTVRIQSASADKITFSVQNARFTAPVTPGVFRGQNSNEGRGSFVVNGTGQSTFNEVD